MVFKLSDLLAKQPHTHQSKSDDLFDFLALIKAWPEIVGPKLAEVTIPLKNQFKTLTILSNHPGFAQQLSFMEGQIKQKIFERFPSLRNDIQSLKFIHNTEHFNQQKKLYDTGTKKEKATQHVPHPFSPEFKKLKAEATQIFDHIEDLELKEKMISLYIQTKFQQP